MNAWWATLSTRERWLVGGGGVLVLLAAFYVLVLEPMHTKHTRLTAQLAATNQLSQRLNALAREAQGLRGTGSANGHIPSGQSLLSVLNSTAQATSLQGQIKRITPNGEHTANVTLDDVAFDTVLEWLVKLEREFGISSARIVVDKTDKPGRVNANLTLNVGG